MADQFEDFRAFLPKYLSTADQLDLFAELSQFPPNIDKRLYTDRLRGEPVIFQGDGLTDLPVTNLPNPRIGNARHVMVMSNSCDVDLRNRRYLGPRLMYCPIIAFADYTESIRPVSGKLPVDHIEHVRRQKVSSLFYLPQYGDLPDSVALLDRFVNFDLRALDIEHMTRTRTFTLSNYGFYYFLFKLSIHLTRMREGISRS